MREWLTVAQVADLRAITPRAVRKALDGGLYDKHRLVGSGRTRHYEIHISSLPPEAVDRLLSLERSAGPSFQVPFFTVTSGNAGLRTGAVAVGSDPSDQSDPSDAFAPSSSISQLSSLPLNKRTEALRRLAAVSACNQFLTDYPAATAKPNGEARAGLPAVAKAKAGRTAGIADFVITWNAHHPATERISKPSLYRWLSDYKDGGVWGLVPGWCGGRASDLAPNEQQFLRERWLNENRPAAALVYRDYCQYCDAAGLRAVSYTTVNRYLQSLPAPVKCYYREGTKAHRDKYGAYVQRDYSQLSINDVWCSDHHQIDVAVQYQGRPIFPWLTAWEDMRSRMIVGWTLAEKPNSGTILLAFARGVRAHGIPSQVLIDNGKDYTSRRCNGGVDKLHVEMNATITGGLFGALEVVPHFAIPYNARSKPIERFFKSLEEQFGKRWISYRGSTTQIRPERMKGPVARGGEQRQISPSAYPDFLQVEEYLRAWIEEYNNQPHTGQAMNNASPRQVWDDQLQAGAKIRRVEEHDLRLFLLKSDARVVGRNGIMLNGITYVNERELVAYKGRNVICRYDPADVSRIFVFDTDDVYLCEAKSLILTPFMGASEDALKAAAKQSSYERKLIQQVAGIEREGKHLLRADERLARDAEEKSGKLSDAFSELSGDSVPGNANLPIGPNPKSDLSAEAWAKADPWADESLALTPSIRGGES